MLQSALHVLDGKAGVALIPAPVEVLGDRSELHDQIIGEIFRLDLAALLPPQPNQHRLVTPMITRASEPPIKERR